MPERNARVAEPLRSIINSVSAVPIGAGLPRDRTRPWIPGDHGIPGYRAPSADDIVATPLPPEDYHTITPNPCFVKCASCPRTGVEHGMCGSCRVNPEPYWLLTFYNREGGKQDGKPLPREQWTRREAEE
jgi:hypothetical protein